MGKKKEAKKESKKEAKDEKKGHLCVLAGKEKFDKIKKLTQNPKFICFNCGRVADESSNLCNPMPLQG